MAACSTSTRAILWRMKTKVTMSTRSTEPPAPEQGPDADAQPERLQKFLARAGVASRRSAEELILAGRVTVNGRATSTLGEKIVAGVDEVHVDGALIEPAG